MEKGKGGENFSQRRKLEPMSLKSQTMIFNSRRLTSFVNVIDYMLILGRKVKIDEDKLNVLTKPTVLASFLK